MVLRMIFVTLFYFTLFLLRECQFVDNSLHLPERERKRILINLHIHFFTMHGVFYSSWCKHRQQNETEDKEKELVLWQLSSFFIQLLTVRWVFFTKTCRIPWLYRDFNILFLCDVWNLLQHFWCAIFLLFGQFKSKLCWFFSRFTFSFAVNGNYQTWWQRVWTTTFRSNRVHCKHTSEMEWTSKILSISSVCVCCKLQSTSDIQNALRCHATLKSY